ncbi:hypothetical protein BLNAU_14586 [Blattamonas nauphoetae]|uniref:Uncharacterized protein n=1 Tax=Blattamonas nauphoetae TaxID=2049346 RepID=A0ABQ9XDB3_9EUKA|nr:hypothetical protein BLNAU_14586 [Blattamonas nauphoetae]
MEQPAGSEPSGTGIETGKNQRLFRPLSAFFWTTHTVFNGSASLSSVSINRPHTLLLLRHPSRTAAQVVSGRQCVDRWMVMIVGNLSSFECIPLIAFERHQTQTDLFTSSSRDTPARHTPSLALRPSLPPLQQTQPTSALRCQRPHSTRGTIRLPFRMRICHLTKSDIHMAYET